MKLLLDECVTRHLKRDLASHQVHTVEDAGFKGLENGDLLKAASGAYEVLITVDRNIPYQQNLAGLNIAILILAAKRNSYVRLQLLMPRALNALESMKGRRYSHRRVTAPSARLLLRRSVQVLSKID